MKATFIKIFAFGSGFALTIALLVGVVLWYSNRLPPTQPWDTKAFSAVLSGIEVWEDSHEGPIANNGTVEFTYIIENHLSKDYSTDGSSIVAMMRQPDGLVNTEDVIHVKYPIFIPSGQKVAVIIGITYHRSIGAIDKDTDLRKTVRENLPKLSGFLLFDQINRYQIELPKDW